MRQRLLARHCAVPPAADTGGGAARRRQRLEAEPGEEACSASIPWVGHHEGARSLMQCTETDSLVALPCRYEISPVLSVVMVRHPRPEPGLRKRRCARAPHRSDVAILYRTHGDRDIMQQTRCGR